MAGIPTANILQPGSISIVGGANRALVSQLQLLTPAFYKRYTEKYGNEDLTWFISTFAGMEEAENQDYFWFENRGKLMEAITIATGATTTNGSVITLQLSIGDHYNNGTQSPLRAKETLRTAKDNVEFEILAITSTTPFAFQFTAVPKLATTTYTINTNDIMIFGGYVDAGERSTSIEPLIHLDQKYTNSVTQLRETWSATDLAEMTKVFYEDGFTGDAPAGGSQSGTSLFTLKGLYKSNTRFKNYVEEKLIFGGLVTNPLTNAGGTTEGTQGFIPKIQVDGGGTIGYTSIDIAKLHEITRIMDVNGCAMQNLWLMDIFQRQSFSDGIFAQFPAGAFVWGKNENSEDAMVAYGVKMMDIDGYRMNAKKYTNFNTEVKTGKTPATDAFRNYGVICPQGTTTNSKGMIYKNMTMMFQPPVGGGTIGNGIRVWQHGGASLNPTDGTMEDYVEMITYRSLRVCGANQFLIVQAGS